MEGKPSERCAHARLGRIVEIHAMENDEEFVREVSVKWMRCKGDRKDFKEVTRINTDLIQLHWEAEAQIGDMDCHYGKDELYAVP